MCVVAVGLAVSYIILLLHRLFSNLGKESEQPSEQNKEKEAFLDHVPK